MSRQPRNLAASVRDRLLARSRERGEDFQFILQHYGAERFLYRLGESACRDRFVLKGAMLFALWGGSVYRPTRDLDFTGYGSSETEAVLACFREIFAQAVEDDGLIFDALTLTAEPIRDDAAYDGLRVKFAVTLGQARIHMQIDVGFGNVIEPPATDAEYPTLLDAPAPRIRAYPQEAVVAEKLHAMVLLGERNSRLKDFYDLYVLTKEFPFDGRRLAGAIAATFERRRTAIDVAQPAALAPRFFSDEARAAQWRAYADRNRLPGPPADFDAVGELIRAFLGPPLSALAEKAAFGLSWQPGGPWEREEARPRGAATSSPRARRAELEPRPARTGGVVVNAAIEARAEMGPRRFKPYPVYKESGVEWLGEIPAHWNLRRLRATVTACQNGVWGEEPSGRNDMPCVRVADFDRVTFRVDTSDLTLRSIEKRDVQMRALEAGDLLLEKSGGGEKQPVGAVVLYDYDVAAVCSNFIARMPVAEGFSPRFLAYFHAALYAARINVRSIKQSTGIQNLDSGSYLSERVGFPEFQEQRAIAAFLDRETARIDALVAKKERLIELLQEKRTALITRAVTKGLDPNVAMKDSGAEWLGEIPAHWEVKALKRIGGLQAGAGFPDDEQGVTTEDIPFFKVGDMGSTGNEREMVEWQHTVSKATARRLRAFVFPPGTIVFAKVGAALKLNRRRLLTRPSCMDNNMMGFIPGDCDLTWAMYWLSGLDMGELANPGAVPSVNEGQMRDTPAIVPPEPEQRAIAAFLDRETARIDALVAKVREASDRLKELRTALISAAVTGKIDVREEVAA